MSWNSHIHFIYRSKVPRNCKSLINFSFERLFLFNFYGYSFNVATEALYMDLMVNDQPNGLFVIFLMRRIRHSNEKAFRGSSIYNNNHFKYNHRVTFLLWDFLHFKVTIQCPSNVCIWIRHIQLQWNCYPIPQSNWNKKIQHNYHKC